VWLPSRDGDSSFPAQLGSLGWAATDSSRTTSTVQSAGIQLKVKGANEDTCDRSSCEGAEVKVVPLAV
jgi:hypothetical protein